MLSAGKDDRRGCRGQKRAQGLAATHPPAGPSASLHRGALALVDSLLGDAPLPVAAAWPVTSLHVCRRRPCQLSSRQCAGQGRAALPRCRAPSSSPRALPRLLTWQQDSDTSPTQLQMQDGPERAYCPPGRAGEAPVAEGFPSPVTTQMEAGGLRRGPGGDTAWAFIAESVIYSRGDS